MSGPQAEVVDENADYKRWSVARAVCVAGVCSECCFAVRQKSCHVYIAYDFVKLLISSQNGKNLYKPCSYFLRHV